MANEIYETDIDDADEYDGEGWCVECGDEFHLDDCGGYNPPCACGLHCRSCHEAEMNDPYDDDDDYHPERDDESVSRSSGGSEP